MNISFENSDKVNGLLTITVEEADFNASVEKTLKDYRKKVLPSSTPVYIESRIKGRNNNEHIIVLRNSTGKTALSRNANFLNTS